MAAVYHIGEQLAALVTAGVGIQTRLHRFREELLSPNTRPSVFKDNELEKVRRALDKHFPKRDIAAKERGWEKLNDFHLANLWITELAIGFDTIKEAARFRESVLIALRRAPGSILRSPKIVEERFWPGPASRSFLDVISIYAKICCQIERLGSDCRIFVACYNTAYFAVNGTDDNSFLHVSNFLKLFEEGHSSNQDTCSILRNIAVELMENGESIIDLVADLFEMIRPWFGLSSSDIKAWRNLTFSAVVFQDPPAAPADATKCAPVCFRERARSWIVWCFLVCPGAIASSRIKTSGELARHESLLKVVLNESVVEPIFRDQVIRVHEEFLELFAWFPSKTQYQSSKERFEEYLTVKPKKLVQDSMIDCTNKAALVHRERRALLTQLLLQASYQLQNNPALIGPKGPSVIALLAASKDEISWYLAHRYQPPPKVQTGGVIGMLISSEPNVKYVKDDWQDGARVGILISCHTSLYEQVRSSYWICEKYLYQIIRGSHAAECQKRLLTEHYELLLNLHAPPTTISEFLHEARLLELRYETSSASRPSATSSYSSCSGFGDYFLPQLFFYIQLLGNGYTDGMNDPLALKVFCSLHNTIFFASSFQDSFDETLKDHPRHSLGFLDVLTTAQDALHGYCPEEYVPMGERVTIQADLFLKKIQDRLFESLDDYSSERSKLDGQLDPIRAADKISKKRVTKKNDIFEETGLNRSDLRPGFESKPSHRIEISALARSQRAVRGICSVLGRKTSNSIIIWNRRYNLREFQRETLIHWLEKKLKSTCDGSDNIQRPTILLERVFRSFETIRFAGEHSGFDSAHFIRSAWIKETSPETDTVMDMISRWLIKVLESQHPSVVYSDFTQGFLRVRELETPGQNDFKAEMGLDQVEMDALASALGKLTLLLGSRSTCILL